MNTASQGSAADIAKSAMSALHVALREQLPRGSARIVHMVRFLCGFFVPRGVVYLTNLESVVCVHEFRMQLNSGAHSAHNAKSELSRFARISHLARKVPSSCQVGQIWSFAVVNHMLRFPLSPST